MEKLNGVWVGVLLASLTIGHAAVPHLLSPVKSNADTPVVIEWDSDPAGIYSVEYSVGLANDWKVVAEGFPSQGTSTRWTDRGSPDEAAMRFTSADESATHRFYRVKQERLMDTSLPITVSVSSPSPGASLSGEVQILGTASASQGIASVKLYVDGHLVSRVRGPSFTLPLETRFFANGSHRISVIAEDIGAIESTEEVNAFSSREASYGVQNVNVVFNNTLTDVHLRYEHFRPELSQVQKVFGRWSTPRNWQVDVATKDGSTIFRSFSGSGSRVAFDWNGMDSGGVRPNPQIIGYFFYDLGPGEEPSPLLAGGGGSLPAPGSGSLMLAAQGENDSAPFPSTAIEAILAGLETYFSKAPPFPPVKKNGVFVPWEAVYGPTPLIEHKISEKQIGAVLASLSAQSTPLQVSSVALSGGAQAQAAQAFAVFQPFSLLGTFAVLGQGHHPFFGNYPTPPRLGVGNVRMSSRSQFGPWGALKRVKGIVDESAQEVSKLGYSVLYKKLNDDVHAEDLAQDPFDPPNVFNRVNLGLFVGHSVAAKDPEQSFIWKQAYVPIYNSTFNSMEFVGSSSMNFGSDQLKWMAFFSCNMFRSTFYRPDGIYEEMKDFFALPMNGNLHIMQGYATEMAVHPDFAFYWTLALKGSSLVSGPDKTVVGAWNYACRRTQPIGTLADPANVARSIYWPECQGDYIYGYGPQTDPNRDPEDPTEQADLEEHDEPAGAPEP